VGLTAGHLSDMAALGRLAAQPHGTSREEIYLAVTSLYRIQGPRLNARERQLMHDIVSRLTSDVEMAVRIGLAERLADDPTAPIELIALLADDAIEVARPVILRSPVLSDEDLLRLLAEADPDRQEIVAARPHIGETVTDALAKSDAESVLAALLRNVTAKISPVAFEILVEKARTLTSIHEPLAHRADLPLSTAEKLAILVSDALRVYIARNFHVDRDALRASFVDATSRLAKPAEPPKAVPTEGSNKLIDKLAASGQLKPSFLLRVLNQGQIDLFDAGLARLLDMPLVGLRNRFYQGGPKAVALACRAVGIDRSVFQTVYSLSRQAHGVSAMLHSHDMATVEAAFAEPKALARASLQAA
jgi:uncharacterized protein (DUF2336 family)